MMSAKKIFQNLCALQCYQYGLAHHPEDAAFRKLIDQLVPTLRWEIREWGGIRKIDEWLRKNSPGHGRPSEIRDMDWSWLK